MNIIDADGWLVLPVRPGQKTGSKPGLQTGLMVACAPSWLAAGKLQILDNPALIAINRRIARLRTSGAMPLVQTLETLYRKHTVLCRYDPARNRIALPKRITDAFGPLPCTVDISNDDGHLTVRKSPTASP